MLKKLLLTEQSMDWHLMAWEIVCMQWLLLTCWCPERACNLEDDAIIFLGLNGALAWLSHLYCFVEVRRTFRGFFVQPAWMNLSLDITLSGSFRCRLKRKMSAMLVRGIFIWQPSSWTRCPESKGYGQWPSVCISWELFTPVFLAPDLTSILKSGTGVQVPGSFKLGVIAQLPVWLSITANLQC